MEEDEEEVGRTVIRIINLCARGLQFTHTNQAGGGIQQMVGFVYDIRMTGGGGGGSQNVTGRDGDGTGRNG